MAEPTLRRRAGDRGEMLAVDHLLALGWTLVARNVVVGRDEIDVIALEPTAGRPATLVFVEVRSAASGRFGRPEESVGRQKVRRLYRSAMALRALGALPDGSPLPRLPWRVDLVTVERTASAGRAEEPVIRHFRAIEAS